MLKQVRIIMTGYKYCAVSSCDSTTKNKTKDLRFFSFPKEQVVEYTDEWRRVVNKCDNSWTPKKGSAICSKHFSKGDIVGQKLRPGAVPTQEQLVLIQTGAYYEILFFGKHKKCKKV